ncbi:SH3 domain-containing protein [Niabella drilacis]|uniref:LysM domain-containing protein n=1 Tax=Niabella drilacis (strain DSM 25811 / CCM 8410 / CCUG 62505 / LMG 26954 / E90) TaxID=1285928 RepID=A0A1G6YAN4_NIADE|nr:SH3 domain-containing protein [Niabella drilacis]SDD86635.1 LysM domain-containing protein [Niabella drilacis]
MKSFIVTAGLMLIMGTTHAQKKLTALSTSRGTIVAHRVTSGESLQYLSTKYGVSLATLAKANGMKGSQELKIGQTVKVPVTASNLNTKSRKGIPVYYEAGAKDNLTTISRKFNRVDVKTLKAWNKLRKDAVSRGQDILVGYMMDNAAAKKEKKEEEQTETARSNAGATLKTGQKVTVTSAVNIRKGASTGQPVAGTLQKDEVVTVTRRVNGDWVEVRTAGGQKGYMASQFLEPVTAPQADEEKETVKSSVVLKAGQKAAAASAVNIRKGPGTDQPVVGQVEKDEVVTISRRVNDEWAAIRTADGKKGYVASQFLGSADSKNNDEEKEVAKAEVKKTAGKKAKVASDTYINIRKGPGTDQAVVGQAQKDEIITITRQVNDEWAAVRTSGGTEGYAATQYLVDPAAEPAERPVAKKEQPAVKAEKQMAIVGTGINIRKGPGTEEPVVGKAENNEIVTVSGDTKGEWAAVRTGEGVTGYIASRFLGPAEKAAPENEAPEAVVKKASSKPSGEQPAAQAVSSAPVAEAAPPPANFDESGFFKTAYEAQTTAASTTDKPVHAGVFKTDKGWDDGKYYALIDGVPSGTIIKLSNPNANTTVYAKVLGDIKSLKQKNSPALRISDAAATALRINAADFDVVVTH